jgi:DNA-binding response OmpR family regulator
MNNEFKILVIDDDPDIRRTLQDFLTRNNYRADVAKDAKEAIFKLWTGRYSLAITDISMPDISGLSLLGIIRTVPVHVEVFVITGNNSQENRDEAIRLGAKEYFVKPFDLTELLERIQSVQSKGTNQNEDCRNAF